MKTVTFDEAKWKLVPVEPTDEMVYGFWGEVKHGEIELAHADDAYRAMLQAAPAHPEAGESRAEIEAKCRADVLAATIRELRDVVTHGAETKEDFIARVREILGADPDFRVAEIEARALEEAIRICENERVEDTGHPEDMAYRSAITHCVYELRQLAAEKRANVV